MLAPGNPSGLLRRRYGVELHPVEQGVVGDRAGVGGPAAQGLHVLSPLRRRSAGVMAEKGISSMASTSIYPGPTG